MQLACIFFLFTCASFHASTFGRCSKILLSTLIYSSLISIVCGKITVQVLGLPTIGANTSVAWARSNSDPVRFSLQKILQGHPNPGDTGLVNVDSGGNPKGSVDVKFFFPGDHVLQVLSSDDSASQGSDNDNQEDQKPQVLFTSAHFNVSGSGNSFDRNKKDGGPPNQSSTTTSPVSTITESLISTVTVSVANTTTAVTAAIASSTSSLTSSYATTTKTTSGPSENLESSTSRTPIIIGSVIGTTVGLLVVIFLVFLILRRRERRTGPIFTPASMVRNLDPFESKSEGGNLQISPYNYNPEPSDEEARAPSFEHKEAFRFPDLDYQIPTLRFVPLTDRQIELEERILDWQATLTKADDPGTMRSVRAKIESLKQLQGSPWAREMTDEVPAGLL